jgi:hypothetical protein
VIRSLAARLTLLEQATVLVAVVAFGLLALWITTHVVRSERRDFVEEIATRLAQGFEEELKQDPDTSAAVQSMLEDAREIGLWAEISDPSGRVVGTNRPSAPGARPDPGDEEAFVRVGLQHPWGARHGDGLRQCAPGGDACAREILAPRGRSRSWR